MQYKRGARRKSTCVHIPELQLYDSGISRLFRCLASRQKHPTCSRTEVPPYASEDSALGLMLERAACSSSVAARSLHQLLHRNMPVIGPGETDCVMLSTRKGACQSNKGARNRTMSRSPARPKAKLASEGQSVQKTCGITGLPHRMGSAHVDGSSTCCSMQDCHASKL